MDKTIDIATTATLRPELYRRTIESFRPLFEQHPSWRLVLHVDDAGEEGTLKDMMAVAATIPGLSCESRLQCSTPPDFRMAWRWCVAQLRSEYVLWLEDDWELLRHVDLAEMVALMDEHQDLATLRLPRWAANEDGTFRQWNKRRLNGWNGQFCEIPKDSLHNCGYSNNPCLTRREFLQPVLPHLTDDYCPEKQLAGFNGVCLGWLYRWRFGVYQKPGEGVAVADIGETWRKARRLGKGDKMRFSTWEAPE